MTPDPAEDADGAEAASPLVRLAILGSCVTRGAFGLHPETYGARLVAVAMRSSVISAMARPAPARVNAFTGVSRFETRCVEMDIAKTALARVAAAQPDWILVDLIDERFDLRLGLDGSLVTASQPMTDGCDYLTALGGDFVGLPRKWSGTSACFALAARGWMARLRGIVPEERIVIHRAFWAETIQEDGETVAVSAEAQRRAAFQNAQLARFYDALSAAAPLAAILDVPPEVRVTAPDHQWGAAPFHYIDAYYAAFRDRLAALLAGGAARRGPPDPAPAWLAGCAETEPGSPGREALDLFLPRAWAGDAELASRLGRSLLGGGLFRENRPLAFELLVFAAVQGDDEAVLSVGEMLLDGIAGETGAALGLAWIRLAERRGLARAQRVLGQLHLRGTQLPRKPAAAEACLRKAAKAGDRAAAQALVEFYETGGDAADPERARYWRRRAFTPDPGSRGPSKSPDPSEERTVHDLNAHESV